MAPPDLKPPDGPAQAAYAYTEGEGEQTALRAFGRLVRRRFLVILVPLLAVPAVAVQLSANQPKLYTASATLVYADSGSARLASSDPTREAATNAGVLHTGVITNQAKAKLGGSEGSVKYAADADSNLITISATSRIPKRAADLANTVAKQYGSFRLQQAQEAIGLEQARIGRRISQLKNATGPVSKRQRKALIRRQRALTLASATLTPDVRQIAGATPPTEPSSPHPVRSGIIGVVIGLAIGFVIAFALERLDLRVRDPRELEAAFGRPILGRIPRSRALAKTPPGISLPPVEAQAFADLRAKLRHATDSANGNGHPRTIVVTSAAAGEGKTTVAWHLACAAAGPRSRVLVIEADLRRPGLSARLGTNRAPGLSEVLQGSASLEQATREIPIESRTNGNGKPRLRTVDVLTAGAPATDPTALLESREMQQTLEKVGRDYDLVIIDTPPTSVAGDAVPLVTRVNGVIVVGRLMRSRLGSIGELNKQLNELDAHTFGIVVNSTEVPRDIYHYYYYHRRAEIRTRG